MQWSIFYSYGRVDGSTRDDWVAAPDLGVQVIVEWREPCHPCPDGRSERHFVGVTDRVLHTGLDEYDPFGWGVKFGAWASNEEYNRIWRKAAYGDR